MPVSDALLRLHGTWPSTPSPIFTSTLVSGNYSDVEIDFGPYVAGTASPYIPQFPSYIEKGYPFSPENPGEGGTIMCVHLIISAAVTAGTGMTAGIINVFSNSTTAATSLIGSRTIPLVEMVAGAHFYVPVAGDSVLEFLRCGFQAVTQIAGAGSGYAWYGPRTGGEQ